MEAEHQMSGALRMLHAERRKNNISDDIFRAILMGQTGKESSKGISWENAKRCVREMQKHGPKNGELKKDPNFRKASSDPLVRKVYKLWAILRRHDVVNARFPDAFVKKMTDCDRADFCTPAQCNIVIEALKKWGVREGVEGITEKQR